MIATFSFDLGSPYAWLAAERVDDLIGAETVWEPVALGAIFQATGRSSWALGDLEGRASGMREVERRARERGLGPVVWPDPWPGHYLLAMRVATYADSVGAVRTFALAAFRLGFKEGRDLSLKAHVSEAARRAGLDAHIALEAATTPEVKLALRERTEAALARGVYGVPTLTVGGGELLWGDDRLDELAGPAVAPRG